MRARVAGLGEWYPETVRENSEWPEEFVEASRRRRGDRALVDVPSAHEERAQRISARYLSAEGSDPFLGSKRRRVASPDELPSDGETRAARAALDEAGIDPSDVDVIMSWAVIPDQLSPTNAVRVASNLGCNRVLAMATEMACATPLAHLLLAASLVESGRARTVLLTQSHYMTRVFPMGHPASPNIGDGATAFVVAAAETSGIKSVFSDTDGSYYDAVAWCRGKIGEREPAWWEEGPGFHVGSHDIGRARELMQNTVLIGSKTIRELMERANVPVSEIDVIASVQPRRWVPPAIAEALDLPSECAPSTFDEYAHLGGCGIIANLIEARRQGRLQPGSKVVWYGQGAGFVRNAALIEW